MNLIEEIVDVEIMIEQLKFMLSLEESNNFNQNYWWMIDQKMFSLNKKLEGEET